MGIKGEKIKYYVVFPLLRRSTFSTDAYSFQTFLLSDCSAGEYLEGYDCLKCPAGQYQNQEGQARCPKCPAGQYQNQKGQASCRKCSAGQYPRTNKQGQAACHKCEKVQAGTGRCLGRLV